MALGAITSATFILLLDLKDKRLIWSMNITLFLVTLIGHKYAIWKCCVMFAPLFCIICANYIHSISKKWAGVVACLLISSNAVAAVPIANGYSQISKPYYEDQFDISSTPSDTCFGVITLTSNTPT